MNAHDIIKELDDIIAESRKAREEFTAHTQPMVSAIKTELETAERALDKADTNLRAFEKETIEEIDTAIVDLLDVDTNTS